MPVCLYVRPIFRPFAWNNFFSPNGRIFMKFDIWGFLENLRTEFFWVITQRVVVIFYRCFGTTSGLHLQGSGINNIWILDPLQKGQIGCHETSVINYHYLPINDPEERSSHLLRGGSVKSSFEKLINFNLVRIWGAQTVFYGKKNLHFRSYLAQFFLQWEMFQTKVVEKIKTQVLCSVTFSPGKSCTLWDNVGNIS